MISQPHITIPLASAEAIQHHRCYLLDHNGEAQFSEIQAGEETLRFTATVAAAEKIANALRELLTFGVRVTIHNDDGSAVSLVRQEAR